VAVSHPTRARVVDAVDAAAPVLASCVILAHRAWLIVFRGNAAVTARVAALEEVRTPHRRSGAVGCRFATSSGRAPPGRGLKIPPRLDGESSGGDDKSGPCSRLSSLPKGRTGPTKGQPMIRTGDRLENPVTGEALIFHARPARRMARLCSSRRSSARAASSPLRVRPYATARFEVLQGGSVFGSAVVSSSRGRARSRQTMRAPRTASGTPATARRARGASLAGAAAGLPGDGRCTDDVSQTGGGLDGRRARRQAKSGRQFRSGLG
jgi:hypothetical protein